MSEAVPATADGIYAYSKDKRTKFYHRYAGKTWRSWTEKNWSRAACGLALRAAFASERTAIPSHLRPCPRCFKAAK